MIGHYFSLIYVTIDRSSRLNIKSIRKIIIKPDLMKLHFEFLFGMLILLPVSLLSQQLEDIRWFGNVMVADMPPYGGVYDVTAQSDAIHLFLKTDQIIQVDPVREQVSLIEMDVVYPTKRTILAEALVVGNQQYAIYKEIDKRTGRFSMYKTLVEPNCCREIELLYEHEFSHQDSKQASRGGKKDVEAEFRYSQDSTKFAFLNQRRVAPKGKEDEIQLAVFDEDLRLLWDKSINIPHKDSDFVVEDVAVTNDGESALIIGHLLYSPRFTRIDAHAYFCYLITKDSAEEIPVELDPGKDPLVLSATFTKTGDRALLRGVYIDLELAGRRSAEGSGIYWGQMDLRAAKTEQFQYSAFNDRDQSILANNYFQVADVKQLENGSTHILFEGALVVPTYYYSRYPFGAIGTYEPEVRYGDLVSCVFEPNGDLAFSTAIQRNFKENFLGPGCNIMYFDDVLVLVFNSIITKAEAEMFDLEVGKINFHITSRMVKVNLTEGDYSQHLLWSSSTAPYIIEGIVAGKAGDQIIIGGKKRPNVQGGFLKKDMEFIFGLVDPFSTDNN